MCSHQIRLQSNPIQSSSNAIETNVIIQTKLFSWFLFVESGQWSSIALEKKLYTIKFNPLIKSGNCDRSLSNKFNSIHILLHRELQCSYLIFSKNVRNVIHFDNCICVRPLWNIQSILPLKTAHICEKLKDCHRSQQMKYVSGRKSKTHLNIGNNVRFASAEIGHLMNGHNGQIFNCNRELEKYIYDEMQ